MRHFPKQFHIGLAITSALSAFACTLFVLDSIPVSAQGVWHERGAGSAHSTDIPYAAVTDSHGNVVIAGQISQEKTGVGLETRKYGAAGEHLWASLENPIGQLSSVSMVKDNDDDGVVVAAQGGGPGNVTLTKYDANGSTVFDTQLSNPGNGCALKGLLVDPNTGDLYAYGSYVAYLGRYSKYDYWYIWKIDSTGQQIWANSYVVSYDFGGSAAPGGAALDSSGNILMVGSCGVPNSSVLCFIKVDSSGNAVVNKFLTQPSYSGTTSPALAIDDKNNLYVGGSMTFYPSGKVGLTVMRFSPNWSLEWMQTFALGSGAGSEIRQIALDSKDNIIAAGVISGGQRVLLKYDRTSSALLWSRQTSKRHATSDYISSLLLNKKTNEFYTVEQIALDAAPHAAVVATKFSAVGGPIGEEDYYGSSTHAGSAGAYCAAYDPLSDGLFTLDAADYSPAGSTTPDYDWITIKYLFAE